MWIRIVAPHFVAGYVLDGAIAPIIKYMKGWGIEQILEYCSKKNWELEIYFGEDT